MDVEEMTSAQMAELLDRAIAYCNTVNVVPGAPDRIPISIAEPVRHLALGILFAGRGLVEAVRQMEGAR